MIKKQRLEELIKQGATIYAVNSYKKDVEELELNCNLDAVNAGVFMKYNIEQWFYHLYLFDSLFETKEDAHWELEMTATRTEILKLPRFEEFMLDYKGVYRFHTKDGQIVKINGFYDERPNIQSGFIDVCVNGHCVKDWEFTKENYIEACKLCKKLFLGE